MGSFYTYTFQSGATGTGNGTAQAVYGQAALTLQVTGITSATLTWEGTVDGTTWVSLNAQNVTTLAVATTATANGVYILSCLGVHDVRARISTYASGTITVVGMAIMAGGRGPTASSGALWATALRQQRLGALDPTSTAPGPDPALYVENTGGPGIVARGDVNTASDNRPPLAILDYGTPTTVRATLNALGAFYTHAWVCVSGDVSATYNVSTGQITSFSNAPQLSAPFIGGTVTAAQGSAGNVTSASSLRYQITLVGGPGESIFGLPTSNNLGAVTSKQINLTGIPTSTYWWVRARNVYRSIDGAAYKYVGQIANNSTTTYTDNLTPGSEGATIPSSSTCNIDYMLYGGSDVNGPSFVSTTNVGATGITGTKGCHFLALARDLGVEFVIDKGGTLRWGSGYTWDTTTLDTTLYRTAANQLKTDDTLIAADGLATKTKAGAPTDSDFATTPPDGTLVLDTTNHRLYARDGGTWKYAALT